jgi:hypothetical protein
MMRALAVGLAIVAVATASVSAATVKISIVPLGYDPGVADDSAVPVLAVKPFDTAAPGFYGPPKLNYVVYAEVIDDVADDNGGLAFFSVDVMTASGVQPQPVIGANGKGDFAPVVQDKFNMFGPNEGWPVDNNLLQASAAQNVFGDDPANPTQGCDPNTLESDVGRNGPVELFRGVVDLGDQESYPQMVQLDPTDADQDGIPDNILALLWQPHADKSELCSGNTGFLGYPPIMQAASIVLNQGIQITGEAKAFDQDEKGCVTQPDFFGGFANCYNVSQFGLPFQLGMKCELHDFDEDGQVTQTDFFNGMSNAYNVDLFTGCTEP